MYVFFKLYLIQIIYFSINKQSVAKDGNLPVAGFFLLKDSSPVLPFSNDKCFLQIQQLDVIVRVPMADFLSSYIKHLVEFDCIVS